MAAKWVDNSAYFGPDRRRRPAKRMLDRRKLNQAGEAPPVGALLRRLRVRLGGTTDDDRRHAFDMLKAAIAEASRLGWTRCAATLIDADNALRTKGRDGAAIADTLVAQALDHAGGGR